jgi:hypothetical protein
VTLKTTLIAFLVFTWPTLRASAATAKGVLADYLASSRIPILST